jgi:asparagine synthase (glutamine-hydrolysing)
MDSRAESLFAILRQKNGLIQSYLDGKSVDALLDRHQRGMEDATDRIWRLLNLQIWGNVCLKGTHDDSTPLMLSSGKTAA